MKNKDRVLCFGDSITQGRPGTTYLKYFRCKANYLNYGLGGDTLIGMSSRIKKKLEGKEFKNINKIVIGIGANDIIQPFLKEYSFLWKLRVKSLCLRGSIACNDEHQFEKEYIKLIKYLKKLNKEIIIFSLPYIESENGLNNKIIIYNGIVEKICQQFSIPFIDFYTWQFNTKQKSNQKGTYFMAKNPLLVGIDTILTTFLPFNNYISKKRRLALTVDGCHLNKTSASWLAQNIESNIKQFV